jgi:cytochrome c peroxidase
MKMQRAFLSTAAAALAVAMGADGPGAEETSSNLSPQALEEIAKVEAEIDRIEAQTIERLAAPPDNQIQQIDMTRICRYTATRLALFATCPRPALRVRCRS